MNKLFIIIVSILFFIVSIIPLYAKGITFSGNAPVISGSTNDIVINNAINEMFGKILNDTLSNVGNMPNFLKYMSTANANVSSSVTQINYPSYNLFAITLGTSFADVGDYYDYELYKIITHGDTKVAEASQGFAVQVGINAGFLLDGLYLAGKFGISNLSYWADSGNNLTYGVLAYYDLIKQRNWGNIIGWRGFNLGTGIIYQQNNSNFNLKANTQDIQYLEETVEDYTLRMLMRPELLMKVNSRAVVIPIEISTGIGLGGLLIPANAPTCNTLSLLFTVGIGMDICFGKTKIDIENKSLYMFEISGEPLDKIENHGEVNMRANIKNQRPYYLMPKIMYGVYYEIVGIIIDMSISTYPIGPSLSFDFSMGVAF